MHNVVVSVIMGVYNEEILWVKETIESILNQSFKEFEFIIILDNPQNTKLKLLIEGYIETDKRVRFYVNEQNLGLINTLNKAISLSNGKYIARMDADDIAISNRLELQVDFLNNNLEFAAVGSKIAYIDENDNELELNDCRVCDYEVIKEYLKYENAFAHPTLVYRKEVVEQIGNYKNALYAEDYDLIMRFIVNGYKICNLENILLKYRLRDSGISISKKNYQVTTTQYLQKIYTRYIDRNEQYDFKEETLNTLLRNDDTKWARKVDNLHYKALNVGKNKFLKAIYVIILSMISNKYFKWYKNKVIIKFKFK